MDEAERYVALVVVDRGPDRDRLRGAPRKQVEELSPTLGPRAIGIVDAELPVLDQEELLARLGESRRLLERLFHEGRQLRLVEGEAPEQVGIEGAWLLEEAVD